MDEMATADGESATPSRGRTEPGGGVPDPEVTNIAATGDLILAVTFENSKSTVRAARKAQAQAYVRTSARPDKDRSAATAPIARARTRVPFRVQASVLKLQSQYFDRLLGDSRFKEGNDIAAALEALSLRSIKPCDADPADLPWVEIADDDEATQYAHRELVFADLLRILHGQSALVSSGGSSNISSDSNITSSSKSSSNSTGTGSSSDSKSSKRSNSSNIGSNGSSTQKITPQYVTTLAVLADRFDCTEPVSSYLKESLKYRWPATSSRKVPLGSGRGGDDSPGLSRAAEDVLRQKILVGWLLNLPIVFKNGTKELILSGSSRWGAFATEDEHEQNDKPDASWWYLPEGLEEELQYRRQCVLNAVAGIQQHFLMLYSSRSAPRQCKLGYDSSAACDSYQLGEIVRFLANKSLLFLVDFGPSSLDRVVDTAQITVDSLITTLRQCPSYQIDKNHNNCGLRTRMLPILDFVQSLLSANAVPVTIPGWKADRAATAWLPLDQDDGGTPAPAQNGSRPEFIVSNGTSHHDDSSDINNSDGHRYLPTSGHPHGKPFRFTRTMAGDQRFRLDGALGLDKLARQVFLASSWDWTADDDSGAWSNPGKMGRVPPIFK
ncbi:hypothetical protein Micbo1qcDRAFT_199422 [Microdochium bolleyi]|uniref:Uncharacterized protein n=1 Tax=Microdochium bolleyi TaxID=196109 RepID=A0A136JHL0_9PEZI|nr:hypothetical protein Micbo1qcDRAFT_199422 [Microdochium bolleyi]